MVAVEDLSNIGEAIEHVKLFVATLEELEVSCGNHLRDLSLLKIPYCVGGLFDIKVQKLMEKLLAVVAFEDEVLGHALNVGVGSSSRTNHCSDHLDGLSRH